jgi:hypothetical protein
MGIRSYIPAAIAAIALALPFAGCVGFKGAASSAGKVAREGPHTRLPDEVKGANRVHSAECWRARGDRISDGLLGKQSGDTGPC